MKKEEKARMRSAIMPKEEYERDVNDVPGTSNLKYAGEFSNPEDLAKSQRELASFVKKKQMKY